METATTQREFLVQKEMELKGRYMSEMRGLFTKIGDDGSGLMHHGSDGGVLSNGGVEGVDESLVLLIEGTEHGFSLTELSLSVGLLSFAVLKDWGVDHLESLVLGEGGLEGISLSVERVHLSSAGISNDIVVGFSSLSLGSKTFSDFFDHGDNMGDVVFRFKLEFDGVGESFSKISSFDFSKEVGSRVSGDNAKYEDG